MARKQSFFRGEFSRRFEESYAALQPQQQAGADKVILALLENPPTPGMRVKPIEPDKYYHEARINDGDRLIHRQVEGRLYFADIVPHDLVARYSQKA